MVNTEFFTRQVEEVEREKREREQAELEDRVRRAGEMVKDLFTTEAWEAMNIDPENQTLKYDHSLVWFQTEVEAVPLRIGVRHSNTDGSRYKDRAFARLGESPLELTHPRPYFKGGDEDPEMKKSAVAEASAQNVLTIGSLLREKMQLELDREQRDRKARIDRVIGMMRYPNMDDGALANVQTEIHNLDVEVGLTDSERARINKRFDEVTETSKAARDAEFRKLAMRREQAEKVIEVAKVASEKWLDYAKKVEVWLESESKRLFVPWALEKVRYVAEGDVRIRVSYDPDYGTDEPDLDQLIEEKCLLLDSNGEPAVNAEGYRFEILTNGETKLVKISSAVLDRELLRFDTMILDKPLSFHRRMGEPDLDAWVNAPPLPVSGGKMQSAPTRPQTFRDMLQDIEIGAFTRNQREALHASFGETIADMTVEEVLDLEYNPPYHHDY